MHLRWGNIRVYRRNRNGVCGKIRGEIFNLSNFSINKIYQESASTSSFRFIFPGVYSPLGETTIAVSETASLACIWNAGRYNCALVLRVPSSPMYRSNNIARQLLSALSVSSAVNKIPFEGIAPEEEGFLCHSLRMIVVRGVLLAKEHLYVQTAANT